jgi:hypothetical protein
MDVPKCESCGMSMPTAEDHAAGHADSAWCRYCSTEDGKLQPFEERFERMTQWAIRKDGLGRTAAEAKTRDYMRSMPAWRDHPALQDS